MIDSHLTLPMARHLPSLLSGAALHRSALRALSLGRYELAERLFERAAYRYRADIMVEPLARLRAHQLIARLRAGTVPDPDGLLALDVERRLTRLQRIESLEAPFELVQARQLLANWRHPAGDSDSADRRAA